MSHKNTLLADKVQVRIFVTSLFLTTSTNKKLLKLSLIQK